MPDGIVAGTVLVPTSVDMSLKLLTEVGMLNENVAQSIMTAAFVDEILSLILFNAIRNVIFNPRLGTARYALTVVTGTPFHRDLRLYLEAPPCSPGHATQEQAGADEKNANAKQNLGDTKNVFSAGNRSLMELTENYVSLLYVLLLILFMTTKTDKEWEGR